MRRLFLAFALVTLAVLVSGGSAAIAQPAMIADDGCYVAISQPATLLAQQGNSKQDVSLKKKDKDSDSKNKGAEGGAASSQYSEQDAKKKKGDGGEKKSDANKAGDKKQKKAEIGNQK